MKQQTKDFSFTLTGRGQTERNEINDKGIYRNSLGSTETLIHVLVPRVLLAIISILSKMRRERKG